MAKPPAKPGSTPRMSLEEAISLRVSRFSGALVAAMTARSNSSLAEIMVEIDEILRQACILERLVFTKSVLRAKAAPTALIERLVADNFLVAMALAEAGYGIDDGRLIELLDDKDEAFRIDVASRAGLPQRVSNYLADTGSKEVIYRLAANRRTQLSRETLVDLATQARHDPRLERALSTRPDRMLLPDGILSQQTVEKRVTAGLSKPSPHASHTAEPKSRLSSDAKLVNYR
ncbi:MAG: DUF2336 domain-containing protein [Ancalomicrobiaceae bacterium]|nr:DUF2336 domain-containing protein [Ancalomicrobiaceae bacterium]